MKEEMIVKIEGQGRIVIPKKIRKLYSSETNRYKIEQEKDCFKLVKINNDNKIKKLITKLKKLNKLYNIEFVLINQKKIIYETNENKDLYIIKKPNMIKPKKSYYYFDLNLENNTNYSLMVFYNKENKIKAKIITSLLKKEKAR